MRKLYIPILLIAALFVACTNEKEDNPAPEPTPDGLTDRDLSLLGLYSAESFEISEEEAVERAKEVMAQFDADPMTRSDGGDRVVSSVVPLSSETSTLRSVRLNSYLPTDNRFR